VSWGVGVGGRKEGLGERGSPAVVLWSLWGGGLAQVVVGVAASVGACRLGGGGRGGGGERWGGEEEVRGRGGYLWGLPRGEVMVGRTCGRAVGNGRKREEAICPKVPGPRYGFSNWRELSNKLKGCRDQVSRHRGGNVS